MNQFRLIFTLLTLLLLTACATPGPQHITLKPELALSRANIGQGREIGVTALDARANKTLGQRGGVDITSEQRVEDVVRDSTVAGLESKGFTPIVNATLKRTLKVEVQKLSYATFTGVWLAKAEIKVTAVNDKTQMENVYRIEKESEVVFGPAAEQSEKVLNQTLAEVLNKLFDDHDLLALLSR